MNWRINLIWLFLLLFGLAIVGRLFFIQIVQGDFYKALARGLYSGDIEEQKERGEIFLKDGESLAINLDWPLVFASPGEIEDKEGTAEQVAPALNLDKDFVLEKLQKDTLYEVLKGKFCFSAGRILRRKRKRPVRPGRIF
jgi:stage V sporulation protein D (sporulation-specific penicillin-binding protein)